MQGDQCGTGNASEKWEDEEEKDSLSERVDALVSACIETDMVIAASSAPKKHVVWVERCNRERCGLVAEEARVGLDAGDLPAVKVKDLHQVRRRATK